MRLRGPPEHCRLALILLVSIKSGAIPPQVRLRAQAGSDGVAGDIAGNPFQLVVIADPVIIGFSLPECARLLQKLIRAVRRIALQAMHDAG